MFGQKTLLFMNKQNFVFLRGDSKNSRVRIVEVLGGHSFDVVVDYAGNGNDVSNIDVVYGTWYC